jgi:hypothetical protein
MVQELSAITDYRFHQEIQQEWVYAITAVLEMWQQVLLRALPRETAVSSHSGLSFTCMRLLVSTEGATETGRLFNKSINARSVMCQNKKPKSIKKEYHHCQFKDYYV